jgi:hypothetical protein
MPFESVTCPRCGGAGRFEREWGFAPCHTCKTTGAVARYELTRREKALDLGIRVGSKLLLAVFVVVAVALGVSVLLIDALG